MDMLENFFGIAGVPALAVVCYFIGMMVKASKLDSKWIPVICGGCGAILGVLALWLMPGYPADNYITAAAVGIASGLAATGANQVVKQLSKGDGKDV